MKYVSDAGLDRSGNKLGVYECFCGQYTTVRNTLVRHNRVLSCGCMRGAHLLRHGMTNTPTWRTWNMMLNRCYNPSAHNWKWYGGRGVIVCKWWHTFENFLTDMGERPMNKTIDRVRVTFGYFKSNCRWATAQEQADNRDRRWTFIT